MLNYRPISLPVPILLNTSSFVILSVHDIFNTLRYIHISTASSLDNSDLCNCPCLWIVSAREHCIAVNLVFRFKPRQYLQNPNWCSVNIYLVCSLTSDDLIVRFVASSYWLRTLFARLVIDEVDVLLPCVIIWTTCVAPCVLVLHTCALPHSVVFGRYRSTSANYVNLGRHRCLPSWYIIPPWVSSYSLGFGQTTFACLIP